MRPLIVFNPRSGRGRAADAAGVLTSALQRAGHQPERYGLPAHTRDPGAYVFLQEALRRCDLLVVLGGDGTMNSLAGLAAGADVPVYHVPLGTENLFAREFGMSRRPEVLLGALEEPNVERVDLASVNDRAFLLMCSVGPDAGTIHRLDRARTGSISHLSYVMPAIHEALRPSLRPLTIRVDGTPVVERRCGQVVVANSRQYAVRLDPGKHADMHDGLLDVVFMPATTSARLVLWGLSSRLRRHTTNRLCVYEQGSRVSIESHSDEAPPMQLDGEAVPGERSLEMTVRPGALSVLVPPSMRTARARRSPSTRIAWRSARAASRPDDAALDVARR
ncbi:MAG: diacylglycerol kinase family protein [Planctomycetota bacterium]